MKNWSELEKILFIFIFGAVLIESVEAKMFDARQRVIDVESNVSYGQVWSKIRSSERESLKELVRILEKSKIGKVILAKAGEKAKSEGKQLMEVLHPGEGSLTDTTLIRKFSPRSPANVTYTTRSQVFINRSLSVRDAVLDMAHELTHFVYRSPFNPYKTNFGLKDFVSSTVEGRGGEVDAYLIECRVLFEIFPTSAHQNTNCNKIIDETTGKLSKAKGITQFYRVGRHHQIFKNKIQRYDVSGQNFSQVSENDAIFISSAYGLPYPIAAIK